MLTLKRSERQNIKELFCEVAEEGHLYMYFSTWQIPPETNIWAHGEEM